MSDTRLVSQSWGFHNFNPRSPRGGATSPLRGSALASIFQSTLPTRGSDAVDYYTKNVPYEISIHAPHEGERPFSLINNYYFAIRFQSTLPTRGSDIAKVMNIFGTANISIHAPHEGERPPPLSCLSGLHIDFNPRSPRGGATVTDELL